jgi:hypothetical protein
LRGPFFRQQVLLLLMSPEIIVSTPFALHKRFQTSHGRNDIKRLDVRLKRIE